MSLEHSPARDASPSHLGDDLLIGVGAIAAHVRQPERRVEYWIERKLIPTFKLGKSVGARKSELAAALTANRPAA